MESANIHQTLHEHQLVGSSLSPSSLATASCYGVSATADSWNSHNSILNTSSLSSHPNETLLNQRQEESHTLMAPNFSFNYWPNPSFIINSQPAEDLQVSRIKEELADNYYLRYTELLSNSTCSSSTDQESSLIGINEQKNYNLQLPNNDPHHHNLSTKFLLKSFSSGNLESKGYREGDDLLHSAGGKGFSQVFPSVPVSSLLINQTGFGITSQGPSLDMNLEALDLLTSSSRFRGNNVSPSFENQIGMLRDGFYHGFDDHDHMHQQPPQHLTHNISNKVSSCSSNGRAAAEAEVKRSSCKIDSSKPINQIAAKKPRLDIQPRASCPPFKVRKEKLGDRIAALQQLVAPFGKTDTATVLMEAIGYIKFLQNQVETLSVPYMKAARNNSSNRLTKEGPINRNEEEMEEPKRDLKGRGLCLVPSSCLSYITDGGGGGSGGGVIWPPSRCGGSTEQTLNY